MKIVLYNRKNAESITAAHTLWIRFREEAEFYSTDVDYSQAYTPQLLIEEIKRSLENGYRPKVYSACHFPEDCLDVDFYITGIEREVMFEWMWKDFFKTVTLVKANGKEEVL